MGTGSKALTFLFTIYFSTSISFNIKAQTIKPYTGPMPVPPVNKNMLFYLQRTINVNTLIYEINYQQNGQINKSEPVKIYWIAFDNKGKITPLTYLQDKFAYGIESEVLDGPDLTFRINIVSYKNIKIYLKPTGKDGRYQAHVSIKGKNCLLSNVLINIIGGTILKPDVSYIELSGKDLLTGKTVTEKIKL